MSDNWIRLVPDDPHVVPDVARQLRARARFAEIAPNADEVEARTFDTIQCFDCGNNLERICCPSCGEEIPVKWWQDRMDKDFSEGFQLARYSLPCCRAKHSLNDLEYGGPLAFGKFVLEAMNPNIGELKDMHKTQFEKIMGIKLRVIYQHL